MTLGACGDDAATTTETDAGKIDKDAAPPEPTCEQDGDCDDGAFCNGEESCVDGQCTEGTPLDCDDGIACTIDQCSERTRECESLPPDVDGDGHVDATCEDAEGEALGDDCDDEDPLRFPGNIEYCDPDDRDEDCDPKTFGEKDSDDDGYLDAECCNGKACGDDCDDLKASVNPKATEVCDLFDNDCDDTADEGVAIKQYVDEDRDAHGKEGSKSVMKCAGTVGYSPSDDDCDDEDPERFTGQFEICDDKDNDCDTKTDEQRQDAPWFLDKDKDGFGDASSTPVYSCERIPGRVLSSNDCRDDSPAIHPAAAEACDAVDNDCSGRKDFVLGLNNFEDDDDDGIADAKCTGGTDCDDRNAATGKGFDEVCDSVDNDCDKAIDEDTAQTVWFLDQDGDGWGIKHGIALTRCEPIPGRAANLGDCDDQRNYAHPGALELCSGMDDDCDGKTDEGTDAQCVLADAVGICKAGACAVLSCFPGHDDCNDDPTDGCECSVPVTSIGGPCASDIACQDGNFCNGLERCNLSDNLCYPGTPVNCVPSPKVLQGDVTIRSSLDITALKGVETITGNLVIAASGLKNLTGLESLRTIGGNLIVDGDPDDTGTPTTNGLLTALVGSGLSGLVAVGGDIVIEDNPALTELRLPALVAASSLRVRNNAALTAIQGFGALVTIRGDVVVGDNPLLAQLSLSALSSIGGSLLIHDNAALDDPAMGALAKLGDGEESVELSITDNPALTSLGKLGGSSLKCVSGACAAIIERNFELCRALGLVRRLSMFAPPSIVDNRFDSCPDTAASVFSRIRTFDGLGYGSQPVGEIVLTRSITDSLEVQARVASYSESSITAYPVAIAARVGNTLVGLYAYDGTLHVDGVPTSVSAGSWLDLPGGGRITIMDDAYRIQWPDGSALHLRYRGQYVEATAQLSPARRGKVEGLWGTFDGTSTGQLVTSTGIPLAAPLPFYTFYDLFIESWRIEALASLFEYPQGFTTDDYTNRDLPVDVHELEDLDPGTEAAARTSCENGGVSDPYWLDACVIDYAQTNDNAVIGDFSLIAPTMDVIVDRGPPTESEIGTFPGFTTDPTDQVPLAIIQTLPTDGSTDVGVSAGVIVYFDDEINPSTVNDTTLAVSYGNQQAFGAISGMLTESGNTVLYFQPFRTLPTDTLVTVTLSANGVLDDGGNGLGTPYVFSFTTTDTALGTPADLSFEAGTEGWSLVGDAAFVMSPLGSVTAQHGTHMAVISTETLLGGAATGQTSSTLTSGPIPVPLGATKLRFSWDFASEEFDDFVGQDFDDTFAVTLTGPTGTMSMTIASVNGVGVDASIPVTIPGLTAQHTDWQMTTIDIASLGSPLTLSFTVSDVGDSAYTSVAFIDNIRLQ